MRRQSGFFLGDTSFLSDPKFRALARRLPDPDDFNSAVGAYFIALAAARRNGLPDLDVAAETESGFISELRAVGLLAEQGFPSKAFTGWAPSRPGRPSELVAKMSNVSKDVERVEDVASADPSPPIPSHPINSTRKSTAGAGANGYPDSQDRDSLDTYHELTGYRPWGVWSGEKLRVAEADYGRATVDAALRAEFGADGKRDTIMDRTLARLAKDADRAQQERQNTPKPVRRVVSRAEHNAVLMELMKPVEASDAVLP